MGKGAAPYSVGQMPEALTATSVRANLARGKQGHKGVRTGKGAWTLAKTERRREETRGKSAVEKRREEVPCSVRAAAAGGGGGVDGSDRAGRGAH